MLIFIMSNFLENFDYNQFEKNKLDYAWGVHSREIFHWITLYANNSLWTISDISDYVNKQWVNLCWAVHEKIDQIKLVDDCETRIKSCSCLHWFDFRKYENGTYKLWDDIFWVKFFAIAYILFQKNRDLDWYVENEDLKKMQEKMKANDSWPVVHMPRLKSLPKNTKTVEFQRDFGNNLNEKYVLPVQQAVSQLIH